jgi:uncharacterized membrane protein YdfJ with MMPL/SSD domain
VEGVGQFAFRRRGRIVLVAGLFTVACAVFGSSIFNAVKPFGFQDPSSESAHANDAVKRATGIGSLPDVVLLVQPAQGASSAQGRAQIESAARELSQVPGIRVVKSPADRPDLLAGDGRAALITGWVSSSVDDTSTVGADVQDRFDGQPGVFAGGAAVTAHELNTTSEDDLRRIEMLAAPILVLLSLIVFRGFIAALLPVAVGTVSIILTLAILRALTEVMDVDLFAINIVSGLGLGLAIDYSLFIVSRYRERLERDGPTERAVSETVRTLGPMIAFSGLIAACALASLIVFPQRFLYSIGVGGALVALSSVLVSLVVLPAVLSLLGNRVNALAPPQLRGRPSTGPWRRIGWFVIRRPIPTAVFVIAAMLVVSLPALKLELTRADASELSQNSSARRVDQVTHRLFSSDPSSQLVVILTRHANVEAIRRASAHLDTERGVSAVSAPTEVGGGLERVDVRLSVNPFSGAALHAVTIARSLHWGAPALIGGPPAELKDERSSLGDHLPWALAIIVVTALIILFLVTRSVLLPVIALLMNALTVAVAFGVLVYVFQDGRLEGLLDYTSRMALDASMPILMFAVVFGLSTDYGVFLLQRIREARDESATDSQAIVLGLERSGRQITAAAVLFAVAIGAFAFSNVLSVKEVAVGTAVAVLVDALIVRPFLFPALIRIAGRAAWWAPPFLRSGRHSGTS